MATETSNPAAPSKTSPSEGTDPLIVAMLRRWGIYREGMTPDDANQAYRHRRDAENAKLANAAAAAEARRQADAVATMREALARHNIDASAMADAEVTERYTTERAAWDRRQRENVENAERRQRVERLFAAAGCPARHVQNLDGLDAQNPKWIATRDMLVSQLKGGFLVPLLGNRGTGKTQLAVSVIHKACGMGYTSRYVKALDLFRLIRGSYTPVRRGEAGESEADVIDQLAGYGLLVIDEIHQRADSDFERNTLVNLLDRRYDALRCTIVIANQDRAEFSAAMDDSVKSRIWETGRAVECDWDGYRKPGMWEAGK